MKHLLFIITVLLINGAYSQQVLSRTNTGATTDKSWQIYRQNSPTNVYGNSHVVFEVNYDSTHLLSNHVKIQVLDSAQSIHPSRKYVSASGDGLLMQGNFDSLELSIYQIQDLDSMLSERITFLDGISLFKPISYAPNYTDVITGLGFDPYNGSLNPNGYITEEDSRSSISLTTTGTGASTYDTVTGILNIPTPITYSAGQGISINSDVVSMAKRRETYSGTTSGSGTYSVTFTTSYATSPSIQLTCTNCSNTQRLRVTSISTTGFTVSGTNEALGLLFSSANGLNAEVSITEK